jgi:hypothetical protein
MPTNHSNRIARRFRQDNTCSSKRAHIWSVPGQRQDIADEVILGHSQGSTLSSAEVEATLGKAHNIVAGSCSFDTVNARAETNKVRFQVSTRSGEILKGTVVVNALAYDEQLTAFVNIQVDELEGST